MESPSGLPASVVSIYRKTNPWRFSEKCAALERLNQYFLMENMHVVSSQYWNQIHGFTAEEAKQDAEGLQTMRTLGRNMVWLLKAMENGDQSGIARPVHEEKSFTNFIR